MELRASIDGDGGRPDGEERDQSEDLSAHPGDFFFVVFEVVWVIVFLVETGMCIEYQLRCRECDATKHRKMIVSNECVRVWQRV